MPTLLSDVRCWVNSGKYLLAASISPFDPMPTLPCRAAPALFDGQTWLLPLRVVRHWLCYNFQRNKQQDTGGIGKQQTIGGDNGTLAQAAKKQEG
jgi:hypothetical protein